jgi:hypothetical protein
MQGSMLTIAISAAVVTAVSAAADYRRQRRADLDRVGFMPWPMISIMAVMIALFSFAFWLKGAG